MTPVLLPLLVIPLLLLLLPDCRGLPPAVHLLLLPHCGRLPSTRGLRSALMRPRSRPAVAAAPPAPLAWLLPATE